MAKQTASSPTRNYIILPTRGLLAESSSSSPQLTSFLERFESVRTPSAARTFASNAKMSGKANFRVLDSLAENGAKLVQMTDIAANEMLSHQPGLRIVPEVFYHTANLQYDTESPPKIELDGAKTEVSVLSKADGSPVKGATVLAFTDFANRSGAKGITNEKGVVKLSLGADAKTERIFIYPVRGYWGMVRTSIERVFKLDPIDLSYIDCLRHFYGNAPESAGGGVTVGVVDTGIGPHPDLVVAGGENTVIGEKSTDFEDNGEGHGTHVGGIIAARGTPPRGIRGLAPGVKLRSYRVFGKEPNDGASNYSITKAIYKAVQDNCDIINLSLTLNGNDPATASAIHDARLNGTLVIAAAGNGHRSPVGFPASDPLCIAISALGRKGTFLNGTTSQATESSPYGTDKDNFIGDFSNVGPEINLTAPGVGIISTFPEGYAVMDGTSMACPATAGAAARLLAGLPAVLQMRANPARSDAIAAALLQSAKKLGFAGNLEGNGLPT